MESRDLGAYRLTPRSAAGLTADVRTGTVPAVLAFLLLRFLVGRYRRVSYGHTPSGNWCLASTSLSLSLSGEYRNDDSCFVCSKRMEAPFSLKLI